MSLMWGLILTSPIAATLIAGLLLAGPIGLALAAVVVFVLAAASAHALAPAGEQAPDVATSRDASSEAAPASPAGQR